MPIPPFNQDTFNSFILDNNAIRFLAEPMEVADGRLSYVDLAWQELFADQGTLDEIADHVISFVNNLGFVPDIFVAAAPDTERLVPKIQEKWDMLRGRVGKEAPAHPKTIVIHDTTILGRMVVGGVETIRKNGNIVIGAISLIDRNELRGEKRTASQFIASYGIPYYAMSGLVGLLQPALERHQPSEQMQSKEDLARAIELYFKQYGAQQIKLTP